MRLTPAAVILAHALAREPFTSIAPAGVLDDVGRETGVARIDRRPGHTEVGGEAGDEDGIDAALLEIARQPGMGFLVRLQECRVTVNVFAETFADNQVRLQSSGWYAIERAE